MYESEVSEEKQEFRPFQLAVRIIFLAVAVPSVLINVYLLIFPGTTRDQQFERFMLWGLLLYLSVFLSGMVLLFLVWKLVKGETSKFWNFAFLIAAYPIIQTILIFLWDLFVNYR